MTPFKIGPLPSPGMDFHPSGNLFAKIDSLVVLAGYKKDKKLSRGCVIFLQDHLLEGGIPVLSRYSAWWESEKEDMLFWIQLCWWTSALLSLIQRLIIPVALLEGTARISVFFYLSVSIEVCRIARNRREMLTEYFLPTAISLEGSDCYKFVTELSEIKSLIYWDNVIML